MIHWSTSCPLEDQSCTMPCPLSFCDSTQTCICTASMQDQSCIMLCPQAIVTAHKHACTVQATRHPCRGCVLLGHLRCAVWPGVNSFFAVLSVQESTASLLVWRALYPTPPLLRIMECFPSLGAPHAVPATPVESGWSCLGFWRRYHAPTLHLAPGLYGHKLTQIMEDTRVCLFAHVVVYMQVPAS